MQRRFPLLLSAAAALASSAAAAAAAAAATASPRTRASFDASWRFLLGDPRSAPACNASGFVGFAARQCLGQTDVPAAKSAAACASACACSPDCLTWDYSPSAGCWTSADDCPSFLNSSDWIGGTRPAAPGPAPVVCGAGDPCQPSYDDSAWRALSVPHDYGVEAAFDPALDPDKGCLPKNSSWYRKTFALPAAAKDGLVSLQFDGVFRAADVFINGAWVAHHEEGYTSFIVFLHNASAPLVFGGGDNVLAVFVDATQPELWSYEQQGIYRHVWLDTAPLLSVVPWGFFAPALLTGAIHSPGGAAAPQTADGALLTPRVDIANAGAAAVNGTVTFALADAGGAVLCTAKAPFALAAGGWQRVAATLACGSAAAPLNLWNTARGGAYLHTASAALVDAQGAALDAVSARVGLRSAYFSPVEGFLINGQKVVLNGFSQHLGFGGCGGAVPERVSEFIIASLLGMGGTAYRTAHNPISPEFLDLADEYGLIVWEENRFVQLGVQPQPVAGAAAAAAHVDAHGRGGALRTAPSAVPRLVQDAQDMVLRDRNHPSIVIWSLCNELGCTADQPGGGGIAVQFKQQIYNADNSRPVTGNTVQTPYLSGRLVDEFAQAMDVQSFSHQFENVPAFHAAAPWKALGLGESGSCEADRGEYRGNRSAGHISFDGVLDCVADNLAALAIPYSYGSFHWTLTDYLGETSGGWPDVSSAFGVFDLAGFAKDSAVLLAAWWRGDCTAVALSPTDWTAPAAPGGTLDVAALTCAPRAELFLNGASMGVIAVPPLRAAVWPKVAFAPGNLTVVARDASGAALGSATVLTAGAPFALRAWVESPYLPPRNGSVIAADGADVALIGVQVLDANGVVCPSGAAFNVTFSVAGPGAVYGVANGDPADHSPPKASWRLSFHGLARVIVQSSAPGAAGSIAVTAAASGLQPSTVTIVAQ